MYRLITCLFIFIAGVASAQDFSNRGKDFWVGYGYHQAMSVGNSQDMVLYFTSDVTANVTVTIPGVGWTRTYTVAANTVKESDFMPKAGLQDATLLDEGLFGKGIHITSDQPIVAYAHIFNSSVSGATLLFPVNTLGQDYYSLNFSQRSNTTSSNSWVFVVATEDNTTVEITPSAATQNHAANTPFTITLNQGQIYNLLGTVNGNNGVDLTGTRIRSVSNGAASCKKIAVFSGAGRMSIYCPSSTAPTTSDNFIQQVFPKVAWGKKYLTVPTFGLTNNYFRVAVSDPTTVVKVDGVPMTGLQNNFYYEFAANVPKSIEADKPVMVAQYITSTNDNNSPTCTNTYNQKGDPEMIYISPIEQTIDTITLFSTPRYSISEHHINIVIKTTDKASFTIDGAAPTTPFATHPQDAAYSYVTLTVNQGQHKLQAAGGFNAIAYGYGQFESYGYNAGTNIKDLYTFISLQNQFNTVTVPATCVNTNFLLSITLPYEPSSITWDFSAAAPSISPNTNVVINTPVPDSTFIRDGKTLYVYKIPGSYLFTAGGVFPIKIINVNPTADGCSGQQENVFEVQVGPQPATDFTVTHVGCFTDSAYFHDATAGNGRPLQKWKWSFGDNTTDTLQNPVKAYAAAGTYNVKLTAVNNIGCSNSVTKPFIIEPQPVAKFGVTQPACAGTIVSFTDTSSVTSGTITRWRWGFGPGDSVINTTNAPVTRMYSTAGSYTVTLVVDNSSGCRSAIFSKTFTVSALPFINFTMPGVCLPSGKAQFTNLSGISGGTVNSLTYSWNFGDGGISAAIDPLHTYTSGGPFTVKLTGTSAAGCTKDSSITFTNIFSQPRAGFIYTPSNACVGDSLTFLDTTKTPNSTVSEWNWKFSDGTISTIKNPGKRFGVTPPPAATLYIKTAAGCYSDTITKSISFNALPSATFTISGSSCQGQSFTLSSQSVPNSGAITNWYWFFGNGTSATYTNGNPFTKIFDTSATYTIRLVVKTDKGCISDTFIKPVVVIPAPVVRFSLPFVCENDLKAIFTDSSTIAGGGSLSYLWTFGDAANSTPPNPNTSTAPNGSHHYSKAGTYSVTLQAGTASGCTSVLTRSFTVNSQSVTDFSILNAGSLCGNDSVKIKNTSTIAIGAITRIDILWDSVNAPLVVVSDTLPPSGKVYAHLYPSSANTITYKIVVRSYSGQTCMNEKVLPVTISATPKVEFDSVGEFCLNNAARILTEASEKLGIQGAGIYTGPGISSAGLFNPKTAGAGVANITYTYTSAGGCRDSASQNINVVANPVIQLAARQYVLQGGSVTLSPVITGTVSSYIWSPATYLSSPAIPNPVSTPKADINYQLIAATTGGCSDTGIINIVVLEAPQIPTAFSPNGDGVNDLWEIASLSSYPRCTVDVYNRYGKPVYTSIGYSRPWNGTYNGAKLPEGVYYYVISPGNGRRIFTGNVTIIR